MTEALCLWGLTYSGRFAVDAGDLSWRTSGHPLALPGSGAVAEGVWLCLKASASPRLYPGQDPNRGHVSALAFEDSGAAVRALREGLDLLAIAGFERAVFGMDADHVWPGCPIDHPNVEAVLAEAGFEPGGEWFDLERDLGDYRVPDRAARALADSGFIVRRLDPADIGSLDQFLQEEFPGRWRADTLRKAKDDGEPEGVFGLLDGDRVLGFALTQGPTCRRPIGGAVWRLSLGERWGALGPIGVAKSLRGMGLGGALLAHTLDGMRAAGARRTIIDWTTLGSLYGAHGFEVSRRYRGWEARTSR